MSGYAFHPDAFADLDEIWEYIAQDNIDAADRVLADTWASFGPSGTLSCVAPASIDAFEGGENEIFRYSRSPERDLPTAFGKVQHDVERLSLDRELMVPDGHRPPVLLDLHGERAASALRNLTLPRSSPNLRFDEVETRGEQSLATLAAGTGG